MKTLESIIDNMKEARNTFKNLPEKRAPVREIKIALLNIFDTYIEDLEELQEDDQVKSVVKKLG